MYTQVGEPLLQQQDSVSRLIEFRQPRVPELQLELLGILFMKQIIEKNSRKNIGEVHDFYV